jgi:hypothetical protein
MKKHFSDLRVLRVLRGEIEVWKFCFNTRKDRA